VSPRPLLNQPDKAVAIESTNHAGFDNTFSLISAMNHKHICPGYLCCNV